MPKADIVAQGYDLSLNRYKEVVHEEVEHLHQRRSSRGLAKLEEEIQQGMKELEGMLGDLAACQRMTIFTAAIVAETDLSGDVRLTQPQMTVTRMDRKSERFSVRRRISTRRPLFESGPNP